MPILNGDVARLMSFTIDLFETRYPKRIPANPKAFEKVLAMHREDPKSTRDPNYLQCLGVAAWATGAADDAERFIAASRSQMIARSHSSLSCWRYLTVSPSAFLEDLDKIDSLNTGAATLLPEFIARARTSS